MRTSFFPSKMLALDAFVRFGREMWITFFFDEKENLCCLYAKIARNFIIIGQPCKKKTFHNQG